MSEGGEKTWRGKRAFDLVVAAVGLILTSPLLLLGALLIKLDSPGPAIFRQERVGRGERPFKIFKLRTMAVGAAGLGPQITSSGDQRITRAGRLLRRFKLDELPQLINVLIGDMSLVGPRPEVPKYVAHYPAEQKAKVLSIRPGITDLASLDFYDENDLLAAAEDPERTYVDEILPQKLAYYVRYVDEQSFALDLRILATTAGRIVRFGRRSRR